MSGAGPGAASEQLEDPRAIRAKLGHDLLRRGSSRGDEAQASAFEDHVDAHRLGAPQEILDGHSSPPS